MLPITFDLVVTEQPSIEQRDHLLSLLRAFNLSRTASPALAPVAIFLRDRGGRTAGGLYGTGAYDWLIIEIVFIPEEARGRRLGTALLKQAEAIARSRGYIGIWLDTFGFQAKGFYERLGYELFGTVPDHPRGGARYFLKKILR